PRGLPGNMRDPDVSIVHSRWGDRNRQLPLALASWCARTGGRRPLSEGATAPVCSWLHTNWRATPMLLLRRTEFIPFFPFRWFRLIEQIDRRGRNGMNSVLRLPGYGSWGRARTGSWLRTNWRAPTTDGRASGGRWNGDPGGVGSDPTGSGPL